MPKKTTKKTVDAPIYVAGEEKLVMFGWCSTGHHEGCATEFPGHRCKCECHGSEGVDDQLQEEGTDPTVR
jgi:hypothetical protein